MKLSRASACLILLSLFVFLRPAMAQVPSTCFEIQSILVDACGSPEGENEMVRFITGPNPLNVNNLTVSWPANAYLGICANATTASIVSTLNATITDCGYILQPPSGIIPPGSTVILVTSTAMNPTYNSFAALQDTIYMIFQCAGNTSGHFRNYGTGAGGRTLSMSFGGGCNDIVTYFPDSLVDQNGVHTTSDGATADFDFQGSDSYSNPGCQAPIVPLIVQYNAFPDTICTGQQINLQANITSGTFQSVIWMGGHGTFTSPTSLATTYQADNIYTGTDQFYFGVIGVCGDTIFDTLSVYIGSGQQVTITPGGPVTFCSGGSVTLTANGTGSYLWSTNAVSQSISVNSTGTYTVTLTGSCGQSTASQVVTVNQQPTVAIAATGAVSLCPGDSVLLVASSPGSTFLWSDGSVNDSLMVYSAATYTVTATNSCGSTTASQIITAASAPAVVINASGPLTFCNGDSVQLTAAANGSVLWSSGQSSASIVVYNGGTYTVTVTNGCGTTSTSATVSVTNYSPVQITPSGPLNFCYGNTVTLTAAGTGTYLWSDGSSNTSLVVDTSGTFIVTATDICGVSTDTVDVIASLPPTAFIDVLGASTFCEGDSVGLAAIGNGSFNWSNGLTSDTIYATNGGVYTLTVTNACSTATFSQTLTETLLPVASISPAGPLQLCPSDSMLLSVSGSGGYVWSNGSVSPAIQITTPGTYTVTVTNTCGSSTTSATVTAAFPPVAAITGNMFLCPGISASLIATGGTSYQWQDGSTDDTLVVSAPGTYSVLVSNICGTDSTSVLVDGSMMNAAFTADVTQGPAPLTVSFTNNSAFADTYSWNFGDGTATDSISAPVHVFQSDGTFTVTLITYDSNGCTDTARLTVIVRTDGILFIPNVFTPNNDSVNDVFFAKGEAVLLFNAFIYNRWGNRVYNWDNINGSWNGKSDGTDCPEGVYYYLMNVRFSNGEKKSYSGTVTLLR